ncbi:DnaJ domain-containing protein [Parasitella parasitica]|nr:DnaJ domain-containing protein [Parasitella parasitica]
MNIFSKSCRPICSKRFYASGKKARSPFEVLSLNESASTADIKQKYKELAKQLHPDKKPTGDLAKFQELVQAYELLVDPNRRQYYIKSGYGWGASASQGRYPPPGYRPASYTNAHWAEPPSSSSTLYTKNTTFISVLAGIIVTIATANFFYFQNSHATILSAANQHHYKSSQDLKKARTEAKLFGNDRGVKRVIDSRMKQFRNKENQEEP